MPESVRKDLPPNDALSSAGTPDMDRYATRPSSTPFLQDATSLSNGPPIPGYQILEELGRGGMGVVYKADQIGLKRVVAIKMILAGSNARREELDRFKIEGEAVARLQHPNIVQIYEIGEHDGLPFFSLEFCSGGSLAAKLAGKPVPPWEAAKLVESLARAMHVAHERGIVHRDLKPANVLLMSDGTPKITDFGLAKQLDAENGQTKSGMVMGTPSYMAPEQAAGKIKEVGPLVDVYALGAILYELLTGRPPFKGDTVHDTIQQVLNEEPSSPARYLPRLPRDLETICLKCLNKEAHRRYASAADLANDLQRFLEGKPILARPTAVWERTLKWSRRRPTQAALVAVSTLAFVVVFAIAGLVAKGAWERQVAERKERLAQSVDAGDVALFRCLTGQRPTWLPSVIESKRQEGIAAYSAALEIDPGAIWPLVQRGRLYAAKKDTLSLALADFDKAKQFQASFASVRKLRGYLLEELGRKEEALAEFQAAKNLYPTSVEDLYWLGHLAHSKEQDVTAAHSYFSQALMLVPGHYWSRLERAHWGQVTSESAEASIARRKAEFEIAKTTRPDVPFASEYLFLLLSNTNQALAKQELQDQISRFGLDIFRAHDMASVLGKEKQFGEAEVYLRKVLEMDPAGWTACLLGDVKFDQGQYAEAKDWYIRAIKEGKQDSGTWLKLTRDLTALGDFGAAETAFKDGIARNPKDPFLWHNLASWYEARRRPADAEKTYKEGCELPLYEEGPAGTVDHTGTIKACYQSYASFLERAGRNKEIIPLLDHAIARLEKYLPSSKDPSHSIADGICYLKQLLCQQLIWSGRHQDALALIAGEQKTRPLRFAQSSMVVSLLNQLGRSQDALEEAQLAELSNRDDKQLRSAARSLVDGQLSEMGRYRELVARIETRRAMGEDLAEVDYRILGDLYSSQQALGILQEGLTKHPNSIQLEKSLMNVFARAGRKDEAWRAYQTSRDLFFAEIEARASGVSGKVAPWPGQEAISWFTFLLEQGKFQEMEKLEERLGDACIKTNHNPNDLVLARASAEFATGRYAEAVKSLKACLELKQGTPASVVSSLAQSYHALNQRKEALKWYRQAVELNGYDPRLLSKFLVLLVQEEGTVGLTKELPNYKALASRQNPRLNATLGAFGAWAALANGKEKEAFVKAIKAGSSLAMMVKEVLTATGSLSDAEEEVVVCAVILHSVYERLGEAEELANSANVLKLLSPNKVEAARTIFSRSK